MTTHYTTGLIIRHGHEIFLLVGEGQNGVFMLPLEKRPIKRDVGRTDDNWGNATEYLADQNVRGVLVEMRIIGPRINVFVSPSVIPPAGFNGETGGLRKTLEPGSQADAYYRDIIESLYKTPVS